VLGEHPFGPDLAYRHGTTISRLKIVVPTTQPFRDHGVIKA